MTVYLVKRLLVMIPTFVGVLLAIWLVMTLAPGEPEGQGQGGGALDQGPPQNLQDLESQNRNVRLFRRQFNLDRPRFYNGWTGLEPAEVQDALETLRAGVSGSSPKAFKKAKRSLEDWGAYAIPSLVSLLETTAADPPLQDLTLRYLRQSAYTFREIYPSGYTPSEAERERDRQVDRDNQLINGEPFRWLPGAPPEARVPVVARWRAWLEARKGRWEHGWAERIWIGVSDTQFGKYVGNLLTLDLGQSTRTREPVVSMILSRLKYSLSIVVPSFLLAWVLAIFLGVLGATHHRGVTDQTIGLGLFVLYSVPVFVGGTLLQRWLATEAHLFPTAGFRSPDADATMNTWQAFKDVLWHITLPLIAYTYGSLAYISRQARSGMLRVLQADFVRTARAKGLPERTVVWRHAVRNGMMPIVTLLGSALPVLLGGSIVIEYIFNIDGFGLLMVNSIFQKDYNVVLGVQIIVAILTLVGLLLTDLVYAAMDPRIQLR